jgi:endonuclease YncB( thermonuclease family)
MEAAAGLTLILLTACTPNANPPVSSPANELTIQPVVSTSTHSPRTLKLKLTLDSPQDLRVDQGDWVYKDQLLSDRTSTRKRLMEQQRRLWLNNRAKSSTGVEEAKVEVAKQEVVMAIEAIKRFKAASPWTQTAQNHLPLPEEEAQLAELTSKYQTAQNNLSIAQADLKEAQENKESPPDRYAEQARLDEIKAELAQATVRSPYAGQIKWVKWLGQTDQQLQVEVVLAVDQSTETAGESPSPPSTLSPIAQSSAQQSAKPSAGFSTEWRVLSVHDGDTIRVHQGNRIERIRFACIDAPELKQPLGKESRDFLKNLIARGGDRVTLNIVDTDRYGRQVAEVFANGQLVQAQQVQQGMAYVYQKYLSNCPAAASVQQAEAIAQQQRAGVWASNQQKPWEFRNSK